MSIKWIYAKNYSPEGSEGGGEGKPNFSDWNDIFSETTTVETEEIKDGTKKKDETEIIIEKGEKKKDSEAEKTTPGKDETKDEITFEVEKLKSRIEEFKTKDEYKGKTDDELREIALNELSNGLEIDLNEGEGKKNEKGETQIIDFTEIAKSIGLDISEDEKIDSQEMLKEKISSYTEAKINNIKEEYSSYNELSEREKDLVHVLKNYGDKGIENYLNPSKRIDEYISLDDQELLEEDYKLTIGKDGKRLSEDDVAERLADDIENDRVKEKADAIRNVLYIEKRKIQDNLLIRAREESLNKEQKIIKEKMLEKESITSSLNQLKEIAPGVPLNDNIKNYILKSYESGDFEKTFKNTNDKIKSFIFAKKGDEIIKQISQAQYKKGKLDVLSRLDLTGSPQAGEAKTGSRTVVDGEGFGSWKM